jgi:hypothetical protein
MFSCTITGFDPGAAVSEPPKITRLETVFSVFVSQKKTGQ